MFLRGLLVETIIPNEQSEVSVVRMKLIIWTYNVSENNDYVEWDGDWPCPEKWEANPGLDYVLRDLTDEEIATMESKVIPVLKEEIDKSTKKVL